MILISAETVSATFPSIVSRARRNGSAMADCLFCRIVRGELPSKKVYEDEHTLAFDDINPQAPTHVLVIPKKHIAGLKEADGRRRGTGWPYCHLAAANIARQRSIENGYRTVLNVGSGRGTVGVSHARASARRTVAALAAGVGRRARPVTNFAVHHRRLRGSLALAAKLRHYPALAYNLLMANLTLVYGLRLLPC